jgi:predicted RNA methylase
LMNPPFSVHSDVGIGFIRKAVEVSEAVYTVSHRGAREGIKDFVASSEHELEVVEEYNVSLPATYGFHTEEGRETKMDVIITRQK